MPDQASTTPTIYDELKAIQVELDKCMHCGNCMAVCPVYNSNRQETGVARGKIGVADAVLAGDLALDDPQVIEMLFNCLVCKSCMQSCPTKVNFDRIMLALRSAIVKKNGLPWVKNAIFSLLKSPELFDRGMKVGAALQNLVFRSDGQKAISPRSPFALVGKHVGGFGDDRLLPELAKQPLRDRLPEQIDVPGAKTKVAFFTGCSMNYFYPEAGLDVVEVLKKNKVSITIPKHQQCCGIPVFVHGDTETVRTLAKRNIDAMEKSGVEYIITGCGSCGGAWTHEYKEVLGGDPVYAPKAAYWSERTFDVSTFLLDKTDFRQPKGVVNAVVTYHDSCHLKKTMKVSREPREILKSIPGVTFKEMSSPDACCGSGGSFVLTHFETATKIAQRKVEDVNHTGAQTVATGCPACMMQLLDNLQRFGNGQHVKHYVSLLAESYRNEADGQK
jgi:glycolate oxidase iron-sulfur subunit